MAPISAKPVSAGRRADMAGFFSRPLQNGPRAIHSIEQFVDGRIDIGRSANDGWREKDDQLGLLKLNQLNSHINQTEQIASALIDSRNKSMDSIINRIG